MKRFLLHIFLCLLCLHATAKVNSNNDSTTLTTLLKEIHKVKDSLTIEQKLSKAQELALKSKTDWILPW